MNDIVIAICETEDCIFNDALGCQFRRMRIRSGVCVQYEHDLDYSVNSETANSYEKIEGLYKEIKKIVKERG